MIFFQYFVMCGIVFFYGSEFVEEIFVVVIIEVGVMFFVVVFGKIFNVKVIVIFLCQVVFFDIVFQ